MACYADAKPAPAIRWYRWSKSATSGTSDKEELVDVLGNEIEIDAIARNDANMYECLARNTVPPATSRVFSIEIHCKIYLKLYISICVFINKLIDQYNGLVLPSVELATRQRFVHVGKKLSLECRVTSHPVDKIYWYKNGMVCDAGSSQGAASSLPDATCDTFDVSTATDRFKSLITLNIHVNSCT